MDYQSNFQDFLKGKTQTQSENESLTQKEMDDLQEAIDKSKETASIEEQQREIQKKFYSSRSDPTPVTSPATKTNAFSTKKTKSPESAISKPEKELLSKQPLKITFQDLLEDSGKSLDIVYHKPIFELPIVTNPQCKKYSHSVKAKALVNYFRKIDKLRAQIARRSLRRAPLPKPILPSNRFKNSLLKNGNDEENGNIDDFFSSEPVQELYVSRSGRQVKRKNYSEDTELDSDPGFASLSKKNKADDSDTKITLDIPYRLEENNVDEKSKTIKPKQETPKRPLSLALRKGNTRSDRLFEKMLENEEIKKKQQEGIDNFQDSLPKIEEIDEDMDYIPDVENIENNDDNDDEKFIRRVITPPKRGNRGRKVNKKDEKKEKSESPPGSPVLKRYTNLNNKNSENKMKSKQRNQKLQERSPSHEGASSSAKTPCPICNMEFLQCDIANHAANCGIDDVIPFKTDVPENTRQNKIRCELCNREVPRADYTDHMKFCITAQSIIDK